MDLPGPGAIFGLGGHEAGGFGDQPEEGVHADGEVGTPDERPIVAGDGRFDVVDLVKPAGGADDDGDAEGGDAFDIGRDSGGNGEFDGDVDAREVGGGDALGVGVVEFVEY